MLLTGLVFGDPVFDVGGFKAKKIFPKLFRVNFLWFVCFLEVVVVYINLVV